jgi:hypothetical protein
MFVTQAHQLGKVAVTCDCGVKFEGHLVILPLMNNQKDIYFGTYDIRLYVYGVYGNAKSSSAHS